MNGFFYLSAVVIACFLDIFFSFPFGIIALILLSVFQRKEWVYFAAVGMGFFLDSIFFQTLGESSLFFLLVVGLIFLYRRKFETNHIGFVVLATFFVTSIYQGIFAGLSVSIFLYAAVAAIFGAFVFLLISWVQREPKSASIPI